MATYLELRSLLRGESDLTQKVETAVIIAADTINSESGATGNHTNRLVWAKQALANWASKASDILPAVIAANSGATVANIRNASDSAIQSNVDSVIDLFADGS